MPATATPRWSDSSWKPGESAVVAYDVVAGSAAEAIAACPIGVNSSFDFDNTLYAQLPTVTRPGFNLFRVVFNFGRKEAGEQDPLKQPPTLRWRIGTSSEQVSRDVYGNPFLNTAGQLFSSYPTVDVLSLFLTVTRNEKTFDLAKALKYSNKVNKGPFAVLGVQAWKVDEGQCRCLGINPASEYTLHARYVPVCYEFEFRKDKFPLRILSAGRSAWRTDTGGNAVLDTIFSKSGQPVSDDVPLDRTGRPLPSDAGYTVGKKRQPAVDSIWKLPDQVKTETAKDGSIFELFEVYAAIPFAGLLDAPTPAGGTNTARLTQAIANARA